MHIQNFKKLVKNDLRRKALLVAEAGYEAINIRKVMVDRFEVKNNILEVRPPKINRNIREVEPLLKLDLNNFKNIYLIGIGKGSALASLELAKILGARLTDGIVMDVNFNPQLATHNLQLLQGDHPLPSRRNVANTKKVVNLLKKTGKKDLVIFFICGGGSALLCGSQKELESGQKVFKELTAKGANILELNTVRRHLSEVKGGGLAKMAYPATVVSLITSDVLGNDLASIASGPTVYDKTTEKDAEKILRKYNLQPTTHNLQLFETIKDKKYFKKVKNILFVSNEDALSAMGERAKKLGFRTKIFSLKLKGEARNIFLPIAEKIKKGEAALAGGESTVRLKGNSLKLKEKRQGLSKALRQVQGKGGRNQEAVLGFLNMVKDERLGAKGVVCISFASDGRDNTEAAGALGDILTIQKAKKLSLKSEESLKNHNSFHFFQKTGDLIFAKKDSFNVADLMILIKI